MLSTLSDMTPAVLQMDDFEANPANSFSKCLLSPLSHLRRWFDTEGAKTFRSVRLTNAYVEVTIEHN